jgi:hypothetical protein
VQCYNEGEQTEEWPPEFKGHYERRVIGLPADPKTKRLKGITKTCTNSNKWTLFGGYKDKYGCCHIYQVKVNYSRVINNLITWFVESYDLYVKWGRPIREGIGASAVDGFVFQGFDPWVNTFVKEFTKNNPGSKCDLYFGEEHKENNSTYKTCTANIEDVITHAELIRSKCVECWILDRLKKQNIAFINAPPESATEKSIIWNYKGKNRSCNESTICNAAPATNY